MTDSGESRAKQEISFTVNGEPKTAHAYPMERLLDVLRQQLHLTGTKEGCGEGECGSCSVLMDGILVNSCLVPVLQAQGSTIVTIEGLATGETPTCLAGSFSGMRRRAVRNLHAGNDSGIRSFIKWKAQPTIEEIREGLSGNLCRCTGYSQIIEAVAEAARRRTIA
jgi:aerobic carbon-monoxide dehydrogenase small subunit